MTGGAAEKVEDGLAGQSPAANLPSELMSPVMRSRHVEASMIIKIIFNSNLELRTVDIRVRKRRIVFKKRLSYTA